MPDQTKKIEVELALKKDKFEQELKAVAKSGSGLRSLEGRLGKEKSQVEKNILKQRMKLEGPQAQKKNAQVAQKVLKFEKEKLKLISQQVKETKKLQLAQTNAWKANKRFSKTVGGAPTGGGMAGAAMAVGGMAAKIAMALGGAAVGAVSTQIQQGYGKYSQYRQAQGALTGTGARKEEMDAARASGVERGYRPTETMQQALIAAKATGQASSVTTAQDLSRITTMDVGESAGFMGTLTRGGKGFGGKGGVGGQKELEKAIAAGFKSGLDQARMPEFIQGVGKLVELQSARQGGDVSSIGFSKMMLAMGMTEQSGMMGARGASALAQLNEAMVKPGGGSAGQAIMMQAFGFGKPGGTTSYYEARKRQQEGATPANVKAMFDEFERQYGGGERANLAMERTTGLSLTQIEGLKEARANLDDKKIEEILNKARPTEVQALEELQKLGTHILRLSDLDDRLVGIGEQNAEVIENLQNLANAAIDKLIPLATATLGGISHIGQLLRNEFGVSDASRLKKYAQGSEKEVQELAQRDRALFFAGKMGAGEYDERSRAASGRMTSIAASASSPGTTWRAGKMAEAMTAHNAALGDDLSASVKQGLASGKFSFDTSSEQGREYQRLATKFQGEMRGTWKTPEIDDDTAMLNRLKLKDEEYGGMWGAIRLLAQQQGQSVEELVWRLNDGDKKQSQPVAKPVAKDPAEK